MKRFCYAIVSSLSLYIVLLLLDQLFHTQTALLLLNIDFMIKSAPFIIELGLHVMAGVVLYYMLSILYRYRTLFKAALLVSLIQFIFLYFQLTALAVTDSLVLSASGFIIWLAGHLVYLLIAARLIAIEHRT
ncbi:hypothetical protein ERX27_09210 [Macrococcus brunensis]|uniref:Uncharacterized protein n=1 Tax=Macrococcus brunensis TaxID=198483 RepID=A0A4R6BBC5_9STAP|nr:hypothetical protein [Macrococcus brunensis]TDL94279.1 hypothetical protein ERX27_09210 [Macrococcus brunensis]